MLDRAGEQVVEAGELLGAVDEVDDRLGLGGVHARGDVDHHERAHESRVADGELHGGESPERHAHHDPRQGRMGSDDRCHVVGEVHRAVRAVGVPVGVSVARQVDRHRRSTQRQRDRVPGVGVLGATVEVHDLRIVAPPPQRADRAALVADVRLDACDRRQFGNVEVELGDVLVEEPELVVIGHGEHVVTNARTRTNATSDTRQRPRQSLRQGPAGAVVVEVLGAVVVGTAVVVVADGVVVDGGTVVVVDGATVVVVVVLDVVVE